MTGSVWLVVAALAAPLTPKWVTDTILPTILVQAEAAEVYAKDILANISVRTGLHSLLAGQRATGHCDGEVICNGCPECDPGASPPPSPQPSPTPVASTVMLSRYISEHNRKRALHEDTSPLNHSAVLEAQAAEFAATCPTRHSSNAQRLGAGENLYWAGGAALGDNEQSYASAVQSWYDEVGNYDFSSGQTTGGVIGHFTRARRPTASPGQSPARNCDCASPAPACLGSPHHALASQ